MACQRRRHRGCRAQEPVDRPRLAADLGSVRSYAIDGGALSLGLEAGGAYVWREITPAPH